MSETIALVPLEFVLKYVPLKSIAYIVQSRVKQPWRNIQISLEKNKQIYQYKIPITG